MVWLLFWSIELCIQCADDTIRIELVLVTAKNPCHPKI